MSTEQHQELSSVHSCFGKGLFTPEAQEENIRCYANSQPFRHCCLRPIFNEGLLGKVRKELLDYLHFTLKETDIYKFHQSGDLANLDGLPDHEKAKLQSVQKMRDAIYSQEFRDYIDKITGCGPLSGSRTDMSANIYKDGDHLLLHDDAIGDRRVSYILYMPDPDDEEDHGDWNPENGGALELYPRENKGSWAPAVSPTKKVPPMWNQMAMFIVSPGETHHAVEEIASEKKNKWRLSIQGWFHYPQPGEPGYRVDQMTDVGEATLKQIEAKESRKSGEKGDEFVSYEKPVESVSTPYTQQDKEYLAKYMNPHYLDKNNLATISDAFAEESSVQLGRFLNNNLIEKLLALIGDIDKEDGMCRSRVPSHGTGEVGRWRAVRSPVLRRFLKLDGELVSNTAQSHNQQLPSEVTNRPQPYYDNLELLSNILADVRDNLFGSEAYARWLAHVSTLTLKSRRGIARRFRSGLDYTLASPEGTSGVLDSVLCLAPRIGADAEEKWASGDVGGYECYISTEDDEDDDASVYRHASEDTTLLTVPAGWNTLNLVLRDEGILRFVKYVSAFAPASRWDVAFEYDIDSAGEDEE